TNLVKDVRVGLRGWKLRAVDDVTLDVADNEVFGLLGPNGCGKSTTMKIILGLLEPTRGQTEIYGVSSLSVRSRLNVGFLPEAPYFYRYLSGRELLRFYAKVCSVPKAQITARIKDVLNLVGLTEAADRRVGTYSKGMLQRIGIAQAIVHDPKLIILDEPTAGVDPIGANAIAELIRSLKAQGKTILLCSHLLAQVEGVCDRVAIMNQGKVVLQGNVDELLSKPGQQTLVVSSLPEAAQSEVKALLEKHGSSLVEVGSPRISLDELFLQHTHADEEEQA
ncbi:MAG: ABC transporter ATP-binding protein, partial [Verrucomicrobiota bacterium]